MAPMDRPATLGDCGRHARRARRPGPAGDRRRARRRRTGRRSSCAAGSASSRTCSPTTSTCSSAVGLIERSRSSGDGRRRYVHLVPRRARRPRPRPRASRPGRRCSCAARNSARSPARRRAVARGHRRSRPTSAGTHPADAGPPRRGRRRPASRARPRRRATPHDLDDVESLPGARRSRCATGPTRSSTRTTRWLHWSIPDPVPVGTKAAFDAAVAELRDRIASLVASAEAA